MLGHFLETLVDFDNVVSYIFELFELFVEAVRARDGCCETSLAVSMNTEFESHMRLIADFRIFTLNSGTDATLCERSRVTPDIGRPCGGLMRHRT